MTHSAPLHMPPHAAPHTRVSVIGVASALGAPTAGPDAAPAALSAADLIRRLDAFGIAAHWHETITPRRIPPAGAEMAERLAAVGELAHRVADHVAALPVDSFPLILGGDHATAIGTWRGVARRVAARGSLGLIWIDAHLDSHTEHSTHSGNIHGMPLAALLGEGAGPLTMEGPAFDPAKVCVIGARAWETEELERLQRLGVKVFDILSVRSRGLTAVFADALAIVQAGTAAFGVTIDLDVLEPTAFPAVLCPEELGIAPSELCDALRSLRSCGDFAGLEIVEYVPSLDPSGQGATWIAEFAAAALGPGSYLLRAKERQFGAHNYSPLPVVFHRGEGVWLWDVEGRRYLDMMSAYSAVSFGHANPRLLRALIDQAQRLSLTSRAYSNDRLPLLLERLSGIFGYERVLPVNTGLEAVETALKAARKWAYTVKGVAPGCAEIIACEGNFHGRSITIVGMSSEPQYREGFGPFPPGFKRVPYGDSAALEAAITSDTAAFLVEAIQGEGGIIVPPQGYLARCAEICKRHDVLLIVDEIQTGLGRTGRLLASDHEGVHPDGLILGKALGGGLLPVSAFLADGRVMDVFQPGDHGSTFGGNPLGAAVALEVLDLLQETRPWENAARQGEHLMKRFVEKRLPCVRDVRGRGLLIGVELDPAILPAPQAAELLLAHGIATKDTHHTVIRFAPPLVIDDATLDHAADIIIETLASATAVRRHEPLQA
ncbi:MAG TPA: ornithine--oxo-acid transaminase [Aromatoleum sp.]|uniref:ornithine--oxo-acid transaminase n=1 Tax=Aromatoleum sp. TaxID=2307007 RepID=UPI002B465551|nr:ornithine--oxo-acid transaminase [Aromatoleum sp.]HJV26535.1 ornithine--oxo-acid transaminase [Aromatoleum sp.]